MAKRAYFEIVVNSIYGTIVSSASYRFLDILKQKVMGFMNFINYRILEIEMENEITMTGSVRQYRLVSRFLIAGYMILFIPPIVMFLLLLASFLTGEIVMGTASLIALLICVIQLIRASRKVSKEMPRSFAVSDAGIEFIGTGTVIGWNRVRKWIRKPKGILVVLDAGPCRQHQSFSARVLGHDNGFPFWLKPDATHQNQEAAYEELMELLDKNTKDKKEIDDENF
ncbi:hypothetical protein [Faecalibaculum rodentium]|uniref:hypothetical protein n=2 Tax=Faecalibaculum rodentium TaxID=1702221 RepID=UPI0025B653EF|nr:hypothetical protein [Faecalibaculum rodentium]